MGYLDALEPFRVSFVFSYALLQRQKLAEHLNEPASPRVAATSCRARPVTTSRPCRVSPTIIPRPSRARPVSVPRPSHDSPIYK
ncbi:unnamed protein product [Danaus chrysippus]|uniref:(African queen) hypothetical protein n=1 Tax=Danaus chrysippus TaxID=151541 RepID=A0A8J2R038_9NEOP|nr:unnamed protein product [Danaus chrysippus]